MGLDVYVGSLTRYYSGDWETVIQQYGREAGMPVTVVRPNAPQDAVSDPNEIRQAVLQWRRQLSNGLSVPLDWDERDEAPYFTDKPAWDCYSALLLWAAYEEQPDFKMPKKLTDDWSADPAFRASTAEGVRTRYSHLLRDVELRLPCDFKFTFKAEDMAGQEVSMGSTVTLLNQLRELNTRTWNADGITMMHWSQQGAESGSPLETGARFAFAIFLKLAAASVEHSLPMKLDY